MPCFKNEYVDNEVIVKVQANKIAVVFQGNLKLELRRFQYANHED